jgi:hypothetical protein
VIHFVFWLVGEKPESMITAQWLMARTGWIHSDSYTGFIQLSPVAEPDGQFTGLLGTKAVLGITGDELWTRFRELEPSVVSCTPISQRIVFGQPCLDLVKASPGMLPRISSNG